MLILWHGKRRSIRLILDRDLMHSYLGYHRCVACDVVDRLALWTMIIWPFVRSKKVAPKPLPLLCMVGALLRLSFLLTIARLEWKFAMWHDCHGVIHALNVSHDLYVFSHALSWWCLRNIALECFFRKFGPLIVLISSLLARHFTIFLEYLYGFFVNYLCSFVIWSPYHLS